MFTAEEIESLIESSCGSKGYQEGGEVSSCKKCEGAKCKCDEKKSEVKEGAKPDFLDMDGDGNKEEPMKKAIKEKGAKKPAKKEDISEAPVAAAAPLLKGLMGAVTKVAGGATAKGMAKSAAADAAMGLGGKAVKGITSIPGKVADSARTTVKDAEVDTAE